MNNYQDNYTLPLLFAVALHLGLFVMLMPAMRTTGQVQETTLQPTEIVRATTIDRAQVESQIAELKSQEQAKKNAEQARQRELQRQAQALKKQRIDEERRLAELKSQQKKAEAQRVKAHEQAEKKLTQLQQQQAAQAKELAKLEEARAAEARKAAAEAEKLAQQQRAREEQARRVRQRQQQGEVDRYKALIVQAISRYWIIPESADHSLSAQFEIRLAPDGKVLSVSLKRSSGDSVLDRSAETAIYKASPLPVPGDDEVFGQFQVLNLTVRPEEIMRTV